MSVYPKNTVLNVLELYFSRPFPVHIYISISILDTSNIRNCFHFHSLQPIPSGAHLVVHS